MFNFLKFHSSSSGDARRHVPFESIIHKHIIPLLFTTVLFLTLCFRPYAAEALAQLVPEIQPVYDTTIESLYEFVKVQLDDTHKQVFDLFLGSYMVGYTGMSDYKLNYVYNSDSSVKEWLINTGADLYNTILSLGGIPASGSTSIGSNIPNIGYQQLSPLLQVAMGCALKSKSYSNFDDAYSDITTSDAYPIPLTVDIMYSINAAMGYYGGVYDWQFHEYPFESDAQYNAFVFSDTYLAQYTNYINQMSTPVVRANFKSGSSKNLRYSATAFNTYCYVFVNTTDHTIYLVDNNGNYLSNSSPVSAKRLYATSNTSIYFSNDTLWFPLMNISYNPSNYSDYPTLVRDYFNNVFFPSGLEYIFLQDFVKDVFVGSSWQNKVQLHNQTDLNFDVPDKPTFLQGVENGLLDLKGLLEDILGNLELRPPVINNYYYPDGSNVPVSDIEPAMQNNTLPESGVDIDQNIFASLFSSDGKKSYISYLWYMTKPLVLYTKDLFSCIVFDPVADFAASGPGYFVYGVVGLGLISGLLVKCLL